MREGSPTRATARKAWKTESAGLPQTFFTGANPERAGWAVPETARGDLDVAVDLLDLTARSANILADLCTRSIRQMLSVPKSKLLGNPRFGRQSMAEVEGKVSRYWEAVGRCG